MVGDGEGGGAAVPRFRLATSIGPLLCARTAAAQHLAVLPANARALCLELLGDDPFRGPRARMKTAGSGGPPRNSPMKGDEHHAGSSRSAALPPTAASMLRCS